MLVVGTATLRIRTRGEAELIIRSMKDFKATYGHFPNNVDGERGTEESSADLIRVLTGKNPVANPKNIAFLELRQARHELGNFLSGIDQRGVFVDSWKNYVRIRWKEDGGVTNPYVDAGGKTLDTDVIVWSLGPDGLQGARNDRTKFVDSDDIISWDFRR